MLTLNLCWWGPRYLFKEGTACEEDFVGETLALFQPEILRQRPGGRTSWPGWELTQVCALCDLVSPPPPGLL